MEFGGFNQAHDDPPPSPLSLKAAKLLPSLKAKRRPPLSSAAGALWHAGGAEDADVCLQTRVKQWLCGQIFAGRFPDGALIPAERVLAGGGLKPPVSMVTRRKLDLLPTIWDRFGGDDFRACAALGPLYR